MTITANDARSALRDAEPTTMLVPRRRSAPKTAAATTEPTTRSRRAGRTPPTSTTTSATTTASTASATPRPSTRTTTVSAVEPPSRSASHAPRPVTTTLAAALTRMPTPSRANPPSSRSLATTGFCAVGGTSNIDWTDVRSAAMNAIALKTRTPRATTLVTVSALWSTRSSGLRTALSPVPTSPGSQVSICARTASRRSVREPSTAMNTVQPIVSAANSENSAA
nr:hypothetical protein [Cellulosimicrobium sp. CUA-896]